VEGPSEVELETQQVVETLNDSNDDQFGKFLEKSSENKKKQRIAPVKGAGIGKRRQELIAALEAKKGGGKLIYANDEYDDIEDKGGASESAIKEQEERLAVEIAQKAELEAKLSELTGQLAQGTDSLEAKEKEQQKKYRQF